MHLFRGKSVLILAREWNEDNKRTHIENPMTITHNEPMINGLLFPALSEKYAEMIAKIAAVT